MTRRTFLVLVLLIATLASLGSVVGEDTITWKTVTVDGGLSFCSANLPLDDSDLSSSDDYAALKKYTVTGIKNDGISISLKNTCKDEANIKIVKCDGKNIVEAVVPCGEDKVCLPFVEKQGQKGFGNYPENGAACVPTDKPLPKEIFFNNPLSDPEVLSWYLSDDEKKSLDGAAKIVDCSIQLQKVTNGEISNTEAAIIKDKSTNKVYEDVCLNKVMQLNFECRGRKGYSEVILCQYGCDGPSGQCKQPLRPSSGGGGAGSVPPIIFDTPQSPPSQPSTPTGGGSGSSAGNYCTETANGITYSFNGKVGSELTSCTGSKFHQAICVDGRPRVNEFTCKEGCASNGRGCKSDNMQSTNGWWLALGDAKDSNFGQAVAALAQKLNGLKECRPIVLEIVAALGKLGTKDAVADFYTKPPASLSRTLRFRLPACQAQFDQEYKSVYGDNALVKMSEDFVVVSAAYSDVSAEDTSLRTSKTGAATEVLLRYDEGLIEGTVSGVAGFLIFIAVAFVAGFFFGKELQLRKGKRRK